MNGQESRASDEFALLGGELGDRVEFEVSRQYPDFAFSRKQFMKDERLGLYIVNSATMGAINGVFANGSIPGWEQARVAPPGRFLLYQQSGKLAGMISSDFLCGGALIISDKPDATHPDYVTSPEVIRKDLLAQLGDVEFPAVVIGYGIEEQPYESPFTVWGFRFIKLPATEVVPARTYLREHDNERFLSHDPRFFLSSVPSRTMPYCYETQRFPRIGSSYSGGIGEISLNWGGLQGDVLEVRTQTGFIQAYGCVLIERNPQEMNSKRIEAMLGVIANP